MMRCRNRNRHNRRAQRGVALITAMLVVSLATVAAVNMTERQQFDVRRSANLLNLQQAQAYAAGGEQWAISLLKRDIEQDRRNNKLKDSLHEDWAQELPQTFIEGGSIAGKMEDLQGRFNLNNLQLEANATPEAEQEHKRQRDLFKRLLRHLEIKVDLSDAIMDWLDTDQDTRFPEGAEDPAYMQHTPPYRAANQFMVSVSELRLVQGVDQEIYAKLLPFVCTLPEKTLININTAPAEVIAALSDQLDLQKAGQIVEDRTTAYDKVNDFIEDVKALVVKKDTLQAEIQPLIAVSTRYFRVSAQVQIDTIQYRRMSWLKRSENGDLKVLMRSPGIE